MYTFHTHTHTRTHTLTHTHTRTHTLTHTHTRTHIHTHTHIYTHIHTHTHCTHTQGKRKGAVGGRETAKQLSAFVFSEVRTDKCIVHVCLYIYVRMMCVSYFQPMAGVVRCPSSLNSSYCSSHPAADQWEEPEIISDSLSANQHVSVS